MASREEKSKLVELALAYGRAKVECVILDQALDDFTFLESKETKKEKSSYDRLMNRADKALEKESRAEARLLKAAYLASKAETEKAKRGKR